MSSAKPLPTGRAAARAHRLRVEALGAARRARRQALVIGPLFAGVIVLYEHRHDLLPGLERYVQAFTVVALVILGWALARDVGRAIGPQLLGRLDPATAGTVGFLVRLVGVVVAVLVALRIAGLPPQTLAVGGAFTAVIVGLAAQQTLGNLFAGTVLLSARPYRVGERVRFQGGGLAGQAEGTVSALGLLYVELASGADRILIPNSVALGCAVIPLREPDALSFAATLAAGVRVSDLQRRLDDRVAVPTRERPHIDLEAVDEDDVVVRISAVPVDPADGPALADQVIAAVDSLTRGEVTAEHALPATAPG